MKVLALSGGVGGAKLTLGLQHVLAPGELTVIANTGDDFQHLGLVITPDLDTALYTLAGLVNPQTGWGRREETWSFMEEMARLGGETWFRLGDRDLALHAERTRRLAEGQPLSAVARDIGRRLGVPSCILPMSDQLVRTRLRTDEGELAFQDYFVRRECAPVVSAIRYEGAAAARAVPGILEQLAGGAFDLVVICPSNPYLSIAPILAIESWHAALLRAPVPVIAVSPLIAGAAVKGPTSKLMRELGLEVSAVTVAKYYEGLIDGYVLDVADAQLAGRFDLPLHIVPTLMSSFEEKVALAREVVTFGETLRSSL